MPSQPRIGLLPLYLELYDACLPTCRERFAGWLGQIVEGFAAGGIGVEAAGVCRTKAECAEAMQAFTRADVDLIVTVHLAYAPSLEIIDALAGTHLPLLLLDTTMDADFGPEVDAERIMYNHGIHGVMDLACMLRRRGKAFEVVAGHVTTSPVLAQACAMARAAFAARRLRGSRVLRVGAAFAGMGDFVVPEGLLHRALGITVDNRSVDDLAPWVQAVTHEEVQAELAADSEAFTVLAPYAEHARSARVGLGLRRMLATEHYDAFSMNFLAFDRPEGPVDTVPFMEASKAMARGVGYAGEGDVLTAALVGALLRGFQQVTFTEIFCPDWQGNSLFLSHMGEINPAVAAARPMLQEVQFPFTAAQNPAKITACLRPGPAVYVNLAPGPHDSFTLLLSPVEMLPDTHNPTMHPVVRGWMRARVPVADFLTAYAHAGGTHHSALVYDAPLDSLLAFARFVGIEGRVIG